MILAPRLRPFGFVLKVAYDTGAWLVATTLAAALRYGNTPSDAPWRQILEVGLALAGLYLLIGLTVRLHQGRARVGSLEEALLIGTVAMVSGLIVFAINLGAFVARSIPVGATICFIVLTAMGRVAWRTLTENSNQARHRGDRTRVVVVGAGTAGRELVIAMLRDPVGQWVPVGMVDDDQRKRHLRVRGIPVFGDTTQITDIVEQTGVDTLVVAIPSASSEVITRIAECGRSAGVDVKVLPATSELLRDNVGIRDIRDINISDVLGRNQVDTDIASIAGYLTGRKVLVTGAGGSIGSELCRQISKFGPADLIMLDRDESALHAIQLSLTGRAMLDGRDVVLCDIRDTEALQRVFLNRRPDVVFHAAALKHLPMLEQYPAEAVKTNVIGTRNVLAAANRAGVDRFVNISTDKAANPISVLGYSKRIAEQVTATYARDTSGNYLSVRFGNVLGSRGSVLTAFAQQIANGGPVTVTNPEVTRYFMTVEEACQLVVQAGAIGRPGEALVLDMGQPVKILDIAHQLINQSQSAVPVEFTGLRPGEKLHEDLFGDLEARNVRPGHPLVSHVAVPPADLDLVDSLPTGGRPLEVTDALASLCAPSHLPHDTRPLPAYDDRLPSWSD